MTGFRLAQLRPGVESDNLDLKVQIESQLHRLCYRSRGAHGSEVWQPDLYLISQYQLLPRTRPYLVIWPKSTSYILTFLFFEHNPTIGRIDGN